MEFNTFKHAVAKQFEMMSKYPLFRVNVTKDELWDTYLNSFPAGTNPLFRERSEHDCACCRHFVKNIGDVIAVIDGRAVSIWDIETPNEPGYQTVADSLRHLVDAHDIAEPFLYYEKTVGTDKSFEQMLTGVHTWSHFAVNLPAKYVAKDSDIPSTLGEMRALHDVLLRSLSEITVDAVNTVLELMAQNSLYRGEEHKFAVTAFLGLKTQFDRFHTSERRDIFAWLESVNVPVSVSKIRNTSIGTLLVNLSQGVDLDDAVKAFEAMVAPANYKRPTALVTKAMIEKAKATVSELGLTSALERRYAALSDITINNILFANRAAHAGLTGDIFDTMAAETKTPVKNFDKTEEITIEHFLANILPSAESIEVLVENRHANNLVSLIAPGDPTAGNLFKWDNKFSWSYDGEMADSIKERVKKAGGSVTGDLCCRLAWDYKDDLDFHMREPAGHHIYFGVRRHKSPNGGVLDLDANGADGQCDDPAENIVYADRRTMCDGVYTLSVNNYSRRSDGVGFDVEIEFDGTTHQIHYPKVLRATETIAVAEILYSTKTGFTIQRSLPSSQSSKVLWGLPTQTFHNVKVLMMSPNFWDDKAVGNKHYFFMLDSCANNGTARGFFNEFLKEDLNAHRKVFEMVGSKMKVAESTEQLSGLGFSSTQKNTLICRVKGSFTRTIKIVF